MCRHIDNRSESDVKDDAAKVSRDKDAADKSERDRANGIISLQTASGVPVSWYMFLSQVPNGLVPEIIIGQEFLDAFPVHQFVYTKKVQQSSFYCIFSLPFTAFTYIRSLRFSFVWLRPSSCCVVLHDLPCLSARDGGRSW